MHLITDADMEDYGFEYSDEEPEEQDVDIENQYYNTKGMYDLRFLSHRSCLPIGFNSVWNGLRYGVEHGLTVVLSDLGGLCCNSLTMLQRLF